MSFASKYIPSKASDNAYSPMEWACDTKAVAVIETQRKQKEEANEARKTRRNTDTLRA